MIQATYVGILVGILFIGYFCANHLTSDNPAFVRLIVLSPIAGALVGLVQFIFGNGYVQTADLALSFALLCMNFVVAMALSGNPLLVLRSKKSE